MDGNDAIQMLFRGSQNKFLNVARDPSLSVCLNAGTRQLLEIDFNQLAENKLLLEINSRGS